MYTITITISPAGHGQYDAQVGGDLVCKSSRQPLLDAARRLLKSGHPATDCVVMQRAGSPVIALRSTIGRAAKLTVKERAAGNGPVFEPWNALHSPPVRPPVAPRPTALAYDAQDDFSRSLDEGYRVIRERMAAGGSGWIPKTGEAVP